MMLVVFETSCALWQTLALHLHEHGQQVVLVSPFSTHHTRASLTRDFSRTDPKDAHLMAEGTTLTRRKTDSPIVACSGCYTA